MKHAIRSKLSTVYTVRIDFLYVEQNRPFKLKSLHFLRDGSAAQW